MKLGTVYPQTELVADPAVVRRFVTVSEDLGYDYMLAYDHVLKATHEGREPPLTGPYTENDPFLDLFTLFAFSAAITTKLEFASGILILPQRPTALVAQQAADIDILSGERFRLGVAIGWNWVEYDGLGQDFRTRGRRIEEQIGLLRRLWSEPMVTFEGEFDRIDRAGINPRPRRPIPIWMGGYSEPVFERAARIADGFIFGGGGDVVLGQMARVRELLDKQGRDPGDFGFDLSMHRVEPADTPDMLKRWRDAGGTHACVPSMRRDFGADLDAHLDFYAQVKEEFERG